jgi:hypothetical protein
MVARALENWDLVAITAVVTFGACFAALMAFGCYLSAYGK